MKDVLYFEGIGIGFVKFEHLNSSWLCTIMFDWYPQSHNRFSNPHYLIKWSLLDTKWDEGVESGAFFPPEVFFSFSTFVSW